jgi:ACS family hexuronate transporter-like MFS transporter
MVNYIDRQVLSLTWKDFIAPEFHWTNFTYGRITAAFSLLYAFVSLFSGKFIDWIGTKRGYLIAIFVWSVGACMHAACGWGAIGLAGGSIVALTTISVWLFLACRMILAVGEAGNFPAAIKVTAEYFPKKDRAFATSIFNSGASVGALAAPATIPLLARACGWEMAFIIIGVLGFFWMGLWAWLYEKPARNQRVNQAELNYIEQDSDIAEVQDRKNVKDDEETISFWKCFTFRQTWSFIVGKFMTDGVWWFFLFWAPAYFSDVYHYTSDSPMGILLIFTLYAIVTVVSIGGGYLPKYFVEKRGMNPYLGRMRAMFIFACFPLLGLLAQPLGAYSAWWPAILIGFLGAGHQAWSANLYSTIGDMFPKSTIGTITGIGTMAGGLASFAINKGSGAFFTWADGKGELFSFFGFEGKPAAYMVVFSLCAVAYLIGWFIMKSLVPKYKPIAIE